MLVDPSQIQKPNVCREMWNVCQDIRTDGRRMVMPASVSPVPSTNVRLFAISFVNVLELMIHMRYQFNVIVMKGFVPRDLNALLGLLLVGIRKLMLVVVWFLQRLSVLKLMLHVLQDTPMDGMLLILLASVYRLK